MPTETCSASAPAGNHLPCADAEDHGIIRPGLALDGTDHIAGEPGTLFRASAVFVRPVVIIRRKELRDLVRMRAVDFHAVHPERTRPLRARRIARNDLLDHLPGHGVRHHQRGIAPGLRLRRVNLRNQAAAARMADCQQALPPRFIAVIRKRRTRRAGLAERAGRHDNRRRAALRPCADIRFQPRGHIALVVAIKITHGRKNHAVLERHRSNLTGSQAFHRSFSSLIRSASESGFFHNDTTKSGNRQAPSASFLSIRCVIVPSAARRCWQSFRRP